MSAIKTYPDFNSLFKETREANLGAIVWIIVIYPTLDQGMRIDGLVCIICGDKHFLRRGLGIYGRRVIPCN